ncbi:MAG: GIY-YIG nuclease family protein, partial [Patescibacteria group bacterium]
MFHYVYVLENKDKELYIGYTENIEKRLLEHNQGRNKSTKLGRPWHVVYCEASLHANDAKRRERYLKTNQGSRLLKR